jgi:predicted nucleotide-binding protein
MYDKVKEFLKASSLTIASDERLKNNTGHQIKLSGGEIINVFDKGTIQFQGKPNEELKNNLMTFTLGKASKTSTSNKVFVVYGHDKTACTALENMLRKWHLEPIVLEDLPSQGSTIIEKLENYMLSESVGYGVVLATADDEGYIKNKPDEKMYRARQNVVLELGMLLTKLGRKKVAIILQQIENMEKPSDISGLIYIPFKDDLEKDTQVLLAKEMVEQGYSIDVQNM